MRRVTGADGLLEEAGPLLAADEARHNLAYGILSTARAHPSLYPEVLGWIAFGANAVVGAALRTPPHKLVLLAPSDSRAVAALADAIDDELPGVVGAVPEVDAFATAWSSRHDLAVVTRFDQGVYALREVTPPPPGTGRMRLATRDDRELLIEWVSAFAAETFDDGPERDRERLVRSVDARLDGAETGLALWEDAGRSVSLAGFGGPTPNGIRIGPVYTPPELRGRGYASAVTAALAQLQLDRGRRLCFLFTDLANPTSNAIYRRIGFRQVCESRELAFVEPGAVA